MERLQRPCLHKPIVGTKGQSEAEHVLENHEASKCLNSDLT